jgi:hypothetical protein
MDESVFQQPTPEQLSSFVQGDSLAIEEVVGIVLPQLYSWGKRRYPYLLEQDVYSVIHDVISETCQSHARYDSKRAKFTTYVIELIIKRMATIQRKQIKLAMQETGTESFSEKSAGATYDNLEADIVRRVDREKFFLRARSQLSELEAAFFDLMLAGEIHQEPFVGILTRAGITTNVSREVNNTKERVKYKLQSFAQVQGLRLEDLL